MCFDKFSPIFVGRKSALTLLIDVRWGNCAISSLPRPTTKKKYTMKKKYDFVKNDHDSLGSLHNTDFEGKKQKKTTYFCMKI